ncbi:hypothetical protein HaLaN_09314 [Haematococcus lacustris]|uniref:Uncharacterized protein n=1 Tax=Haematococcus lacustris TaxID=44745 RepID=A0A699Z329_HAELA|nr:hypothetical protein HaLaN_09314 [Haematococcus lacustris]
MERWQASAQQVTAQRAAEEREQQGRDAEELLPEEVWKELLDPTLRREHAIVAWRVLHGSLMPGQLETLTHAFLTCPAVAPVWDSGAATALQPQMVAQRVAEEVVLTLSSAVKRDWHR